MIKKWVIGPVEHVRAEIKPMHFVAETEHYVMNERGRRKIKRSNYYQIVDTWEEARDILRSRATDKVVDAKARLSEAELMLDKINAMVPPP